MTLQPKPLERRGREVKKDGFLRGTKLWKWRNTFISTSLVSIISLFAFAAIYSDRNPDKLLNFKKFQERFAISQRDPNRVAELEKRLEKIKQTRAMGDDKH